MCQIIVFDEKSPTDVKTIEGIIEDSQLCNSDGTGIGWVEDKKAHWHKGVNLKAASIAKLVAQLPRPVVVHTRIKTAGGKINALCHPFPASQPNTTSGSDPQGILFHNGVFTPWRSLAAILGLKTNYTSWSDTKVLANAVRYVGWTRVIKAVKEDGSDKLAILHPKWKNPLQLVGNFTRDRGVLISSAFFRWNYGGRDGGGYWDGDEWQETRGEDGIRYFTRKSAGSTRLAEMMRQEEVQEGYTALKDRHYMQPSQGGIAVWCQSCQDHHPVGLCPLNPLTGD